jgi:uncharacterized membrane protein
MDVFFFFAEHKPLVAVLHVLAVVFGMGGAVAADVLFAYFAYNKRLSHGEVRVMQRLSHMVSVGLLCILVSGCMLFLSSPETYAVSTKFLLKITVVVVLAVNGLLLHRYVFAHLADYHVLTHASRHVWRRWAVTMGAISSVSWMCALALGVLDSIPVPYATALAVYVSMLLCSVLCALGILRWYERRV